MLIFTIIYYRHTSRTCLQLHFLGPFPAQKMPTTAEAESLRHWQGTACSVRWPINSVVMQRNIKVIAKGVANTCWTMQRLGGFWLVVQTRVGWFTVILTCYSSWVTFCASIVARMFQNIFVTSSKIEINLPLESTSYLGFKDFLCSLPSFGGRDALIWLAHDDAVIGGKHHQLVTQILLNFSGCCIHKASGDDPKSTVEQWKPPFSPKDPFFRGDRSMDRWMDR